MIELTSSEERYVIKMIHKKPIFAIAKELTKTKNLKNPITRRDLVKYFREKYQRDLIKEKFNQK